MLNVHKICKHSMKILIFFRSFLILTFFNCFIISEFSFADNKDWIIGKPESSYYEISFRMRSGGPLSQEDMFQRRGQRVVNLYLATNPVDGKTWYMRISHKARVIGILKGEWFIHVPKSETKKIDLALKLGRLGIHPLEVGFTEINETRILKRLTELANKLD